jgi:Tfp pilus assembly protein PilV
MGVMQGTPRRLDARASRRLRDEAGFAMVEVMVSAVLLIVLSLATLSVLDKAQKTSSNNRSRDVAAQIAQSEQDAIRQLPVSALALGYHPGTKPVPMGGITYQVTSTADWVTDSGGAVTCSTTGTIAYLQTKTTVTWPGMGSIAPVTADAIVDPGVAALGAKKGALTVLLTRADGSGTPGVTVTAGGTSAVTDNNGCAVIGNLDVGPQTLTYNDARYVDKTGRHDVSKDVTIGAGTIAQATGNYDYPGTLDMKLVDDAGNTAKWQVFATGQGAMTIEHTLLGTPPRYTTPLDSSDSALKIDVFPFPSAYKTYVGECTGNDPSTYGNTAQGAQVNPGQTTTPPLGLTMPTTTVNLGSSGAGASVLVAAETAAPSMAGCPTTPYGKWFANSSGVAKIPLPYGVWRVCASVKSGSSWRQSVTSSTWPRGSLTNGAVINTGAAGSGNYARQTSTTLTMRTSGTPSSGSDYSSC